jgi:2-iminobutanoate/2-iminopropanoate deaminase
MPKQQIVTENAPIPAAPYSQGIRVGDFVYTAGQGPIRLDGTMPESIEDQTRQTLENVKAILEAGGASMADVVKVTVHLADLALFTRFNGVYAEYFPDPKPVRTTVGSQLNNILVEIDVVAYTGA